MGRPRKWPSKCQLTWCGSPQSSHGYCKAHATRLRRGMDLAPEIKARGPNVRQQVLAEVAIICDYWAGNYASPEVAELAALFRRLK